MLLRLTIVVLFLLECACLPASAQAPVPASPTLPARRGIDPKLETLAKTFLLQTQRGKVDRAQLSAWLNRNLTPHFVQEAGARLSKLGALRAFSYVGSSTSVPGAHAHAGPPDTYYEFLATFANREIGWLVGIDSDGKIDGATFLPYQAPMHLHENQLIAALRTEMQREAGSKTFSGAVLLAKGGRAVFSRAYGLADRARNLPNTLSTRFRIGSMNKMFTAVAVMQLVQAGKVGLDDTVGTYLKDYPNKEIASKVTIRELLTHTGGTGDIFGPAFFKHRLELRTLDDYVKLYGHRAPLFTPGARYEYSNYGFILLGRVIEQVSGQRYYDFVRQHVYEPAGMSATGSQPESTPVAQRSVGYTLIGKTEQPNTDTLPYRGTSAGGGYTTVGDLLRFANALQANQLLDAKYTRLLTTGKVAMPSFPDRPREYAFGFVDRTFDGERCFGHDGGAPGMSGDLEICPGAGYVIAVLANVDPPAADAVSQFVVSRLP